MFCIAAEEHFEKEKKKKKKIVFILKHNLAIVERNDRGWNSQKSRKEADCPTNLQNGPVSLNQEIPLSDFCATTCQSVPRVFFISLTTPTQLYATCSRGTGGEGECHERTSEWK
ncbi:hypothetical protein CEXT_294321 [Caerostris extrusa]|uniref:Uncharacterized protein n=1 Tax=Caerostris extrusa TaxID=172846 RepID=A0AAV4MY58_CAEEX|nr:hypothetical protein CEXT_294321 [Caerostris extrusa]